MSSSTPLNDLTENFFQCSLCFDQFKEPKLLPCLHRYCSDCLKTLSQSSTDGNTICPLCKQTYKIPKKGVDDFKTDFHTKSMLEFIKLQQSFENKDLKKCVSCTKVTTVSAYCFKCRDFLCDKCYKVHVSNKMFDDHKPHTLKVGYIAENNLTLEKLAALTEDPRCHTHIKEYAKLCCSTCRNEPVCVICTYSKHKGHDLHDVSEQAMREREGLILKLNEVNKHKSKLFELPNKIEITKRKLRNNILKKKKTITKQFQSQNIKVEDKLKKQREDRQKGSRDIDARWLADHEQIDIRFEEEDIQLRRKYDLIRKSCNIQYDDESEIFIEKCDNIESDLCDKQVSLKANFNKQKATIKVLKKQNEDELKRISDYCEQIIKRYDNFTATASSILASNDDWTDVQCIPDIRVASTPLLKEMKQKHPEVETLSEFVISDITKLKFDDVTISVINDSVVDIDYWTKYLVIAGATSSLDGNMVITGKLSKEYSHITVINRKGEIQRQDQIKRAKIFRPYGFCCTLSKFKVVAVPVPDTIGICDVRDDSSYVKNISDVISSWSAGRFISSIAVDHVNNQVIVGTNSNKVYVLDNELNYSHTLTLPDAIRMSRNITVHQRNLLICDYSANNAYAVTVNGSESKLLYEIIKPCDHKDWRPLSICADNNYFIYVLWRTENSDESLCLLAQYSQDGRQMLKAISVDSDARCIITSEADGSEKILLATYGTGRIYTYRLIEGTKTQVP